jgi:5-methyltetrahydropteroyltriglutamate--homocysteine methyltransferase
MPIPTEPIGSIPRPRALMDAVLDSATPPERLEALFDEAVRDTVAHFEATGSPVITDGEQAKVMSFASYSVHGAPNMIPHGVVVLPFADGHVRRLPQLIKGPFRYQRYAAVDLDRARKFTRMPLKQAVISASALSLTYPVEEMPDYWRAAFIADLVRESELDIRHCLAKGAHCVQIDFTEGRLAIKVDPSKELLRAFVDVNNQVLERFTPEERQHIGVHTCPGSDGAQPHSADVDYAELLPYLFQIKAGNFYIQLAGEPDRVRVLQIIKRYMQADHHIFVGVIDPSNPRLETPEEVRDRTLEAAEYIPIEQLGTTDDCGFSPFADDATRTREVAFAKIRARVEGTALASKKLGI